MTLGANRWIRRKWPTALSALTLAVAVTVPAVIASATASGASTKPYQLTNGLPAGAKLLDVGGLTPRSAFGGHVAHGIPNLDWHTELAPEQTSSLVVQIPYGDYYYQLNGDGTCCAFILVDANTFDNQFFNTIVEAINAGTITTRDISTFLFPNTYLYLGTPSVCCVLGFHSYVFNDLPSGVEQRWVLNYSSWISPGLYPGGLQDVTALSHEMAETFADPFVVSDGIHGLTPWWLSPNGNCQDDLEVGDVIEGLPDAVYPVTLHGFLYHPQNVALAQWFATGQPSDALDGAFSYPDESVLTSPATFQNVNCS